MGRTILAHSAPGSTWKDHKYSKRVKTPNGWGYVYNNGSHNTISLKSGTDKIKDLFKTKEQKERERKERYAKSKVEDAYDSGLYGHRKNADSPYYEQKKRESFDDYKSEAYRYIDDDSRRVQRQFNAFLANDDYRSKTNHYNTSADDFVASGNRARKRRELELEKRERRELEKGSRIGGEGANLDARRSRNKTTNTRARGFSSSVDGFTRKPEAARHNTNEENLGVYDYHGGIFDNELDYDPRYYKVYRYGNKDYGVHTQYLLKPNKNNLKDRGYGSSIDNNNGGKGALVAGTPEYTQHLKDKVGPVFKKFKDAGVLHDNKAGAKGYLNDLHIARQFMTLANRHSSLSRKEIDDYIRYVLGVNPDGIEHGDINMNNQYLAHSAEGTTWKKKNPKYERRVGTPPNAYYIYRNGSHSTGPVKNLKTSGSDVSDAWEEAASTTGSYIKETGEEAAESIKNAVSTTGNYVKEKAVETKDQAQAYVNRKADETRTAINRHANAAKRNIDELKTKSRAAAEDAKRQIDAAANEANRQVTKVKNSAINTYVNTKANVARSYNNAKESATNTYNRVAGEVQAYGKRARESAINTRNSIQRSAKAAQRNFEEGVNNTVNTARNAYNQGVSNARASINSARNYLNVQKARLQNSYNNAANYAKSEYNRILKEAQRQIDAIEARARKIANASSNLASDIGGAGRKWKEEAFHDGMYNGAYIIHKVPSNPELTLCHSRAGTTWEKLNHKYIAKIDGKYFYTPEELRAFKSGAGDKARGLADKGKEYWDKTKEKGSEYLEKGKEGIKEGYSKGKAALTRSSRLNRYNASKMADDLVSGRKNDYTDHETTLKEYQKARDSALRRRKESAYKARNNSKVYSNWTKEDFNRDARMDKERRDITRNFHNDNRGYTKSYNDDPSGKGRTYLNRKYRDELMADDKNLKKRGYSSSRGANVDPDLAPDTVQSAKERAYGSDTIKRRRKLRTNSTINGIKKANSDKTAPFKNISSKGYSSSKDNRQGGARASLLGRKDATNVRNTLGDTTRGYSTSKSKVGAAGADRKLKTDEYKREFSSSLNKGYESAKRGASKGAEYAKEGYSKAKQGASKGYEYAKRGASKGAEYAREGYSKAKDWYDEQKRKREYRRGFRSGWNSVRGN